MSSPITVLVCDPKGRPSISPQHNFSPIILPKKKKERKSPQPLVLPTCSGRSPKHKLVIRLSTLLCPLLRSSVKIWMITLVSSKILVRGYVWPLQVLNGQNRSQSPLVGVSGVAVFVGPVGPFGLLWVDHSSSGLRTPRLLLAILNKTTQRKRTHYRGRTT